jgi:hypothetical protein
MRYTLVCTGIGCVLGNRPIDEDERDAWHKVEGLTIGQIVGHYVAADHEGAVAQLTLRLLGSGDDG